MGDRPDTLCGARDLAAKRPVNRPGLARIDYRIGTQPEFLDRLAWGIPRQQVVDPDSGLPVQPLARLRRRDTGDPTIALLDSFAMTLDTLSFYSERIANEGYLGTAGERRSLVELARTIGYEPAPGGAASVYLALEVESADDPYRAIEVASGLQALSVPQAKGELPQVFETVETITARAEWNAMPVRKEHDQNLALCRTGNGGLVNRALYLFDTDNSFDETQIDAADLLRVADPAVLDDFYPVTPGLDLTGALAQLQADSALNPEIVPELRAVQVNEVFLRGTGLGLARAARIAVVGIRIAADASRHVETAVFHVAESSEDSTLGITRLIVRQPKQSVGRFRLAPLRRAPRLKLLSLPSERVAFDGPAVEHYVRTASWTETSLNAFVRTQAWPREKLLFAIRRRPEVTVPETSEPQAGLFLMREDAGFFGNAAVRWETLAKPDEARGTDPYPASWDGSDPTSIWEDSQRTSLADIGMHALLEREIKQVAPDGWAVLEPGTGNAKVLRVAGAQTLSRADYAMSAKVTGLLFNTPDNTAFSPSANDANFRNRTSKCFCASEALVTAGTPIRDGVNAGETTIDLDGLFLDLKPGQAISIRGERSDLAGITDAEALIAEDVFHIGGHTRLLVDSGLANSYLRATVTLNANMARATHGETQTELLGSGEASRTNQNFKLAKAPLTYVSAATASGRASTLEIRIDEVLWHEVGALYDAGPEDAVYMVRREDDGSSWVWFGDGVHGRRLPTGTNNVAATYRAGSGLSGEVGDEAITQLKTRPLGLRSVYNPAPATGSAEAETSDKIRLSAPRSVRTLGRIVSLRDYQDYAETYPGIGKARVDALWSGQHRLAHLSVSPESDSQFDPSAQTLLDLIASLEQFRDARNPLVVAQCLRRYFQVAACLQYHPDYLADLVKADAQQALLDGFGYAARGIAQPVSAAEVTSTLQQVPGVVGVDVDILSRIELNGSGGSSTLATILTAAPAQALATSTGVTLQPAELLTILPSGIGLTMEPAHA
ncbi:putative baseplate assembly protein [Sphingomonas sp. SUN039]|uniref:putative baseplate assembly protein n=1 Tax=Sphingomonas sp. SUN039 TaxID=2937787 RepID=UPI002164804F|nr:putative baseplate assembly protein [Sphingomonas sp. SUN039]UVO55691.1 putative baseplate assembly protein [Sphingomonas sp. SUN039]